MTNVEAKTNITVEITEYVNGTVKTAFGSDHFGAAPDKKLKFAELADLNLTYDPNYTSSGDQAAAIQNRYDSNHNNLLDQEDIAKLANAVDKKNHAAFQKACPKGTIKLSALIALAENLEITEKDLSNLSAPQLNVTLKDVNTVKAGR